MELKYCPNGLKDKEREQIKIYMEQDVCLMNIGIELLDFL